MQTMPLLHAFARMEGFYAQLAAPDIPQRDHNPGDICDGSFAREQRGYAGADGRFARFASDDAGFAAMRALLSGPGYRGKTIAEVVARYAPPNENDTQRYVGLVCEWSGLPANTVIDGHLG